MLNRSYEWYLIVNVQPTSQTIDNRALAAREVMEALVKASTLDLALNCAAGVVAGFDANFGQNSPIIRLLVGAIRSHDSAFPEDLSENALELRVCAAIALGELVAASGNETPSVRALQIASVLRSGLSVRPPMEGKYLKQMLVELDETAARALATGAASRRIRVVKFTQRLAKLSEAELGTSIATPAIKAIIKEIYEQSVIDREELDVLWWMFAGVSMYTGHAIAELPAGAAAMCCGAELGSRCLVPPTEGLEALVRRAYKSEREPSGMVDRNIEEVAADWDSHLQSILVPDEGTRTLAKDHPSLFPLSWLCDRRLASKNYPNWLGEFQHITGIPSNYALSPVNWAIQAFRERTAHRICAGEFKG